MVAQAAKLAAEAAGPRPEPDRDNQIDRLTAKFENPRPKDEDIDLSISRLLSKSPSAASGSGSGSGPAPYPYNKDSRHATRKKSIWDREVTRHNGTSNSKERRPAAAAVEAGPGIGWEATGLRKVVAETVRRAFPGASHVTSIQAALLKELINGFSVIVSSKPCSGKSFAIAVWLLALGRAVPLSKKGNKPLTTTALILVPSQDLALQYYDHLTGLLRGTGSAAVMANPADFVQVLFRSGGLADRIALLREHRNPHILIATPAVLLDILSSTNPEVRQLVDYNSLRAIVVEEAEEALHRYDYPIVDDVPPAPPEKTKDPLLILLNYVSESRKVTAIKMLKKPTQPQIVLPSSYSGTFRLKSIIEACEILASRRCQTVIGASCLCARPTAHPDSSDI